jgi:hypothetical protein
MKYRALLTSVAAATLCCFTLGCPPAEDATMTDEVSTMVEDGDSTTDAAPIMGEGEMTDGDEMKEGGE